MRYTYVHTMVEFNEDKQNRKIGDLLKHEEEELVQYLSAKYGVDYVDLNVTLINTDALRLIEEKTARETKSAAYNLVKLAYAGLYFRTHT